MDDQTRYSFKNLELWKTAQQFSVDVARMADALPTQRSVDIAARQLIRAATSVAANVAEGHGRFSFAAYRNHLSIAKDSASECQSWIDFLARLGFVDESIGRDLDSQCVTLIASLTRRIVGLEKQEKSLRVRESGPGYEAELSVPRFQGPRVGEGRGDEE